MKVYVVMNDLGYEQPIFLDVYTDLEKLKQDYPDVIRTEGPDYTVPYELLPNYIYFETETK